MYKGVREEAKNLANNTDFALVADIDGGCAEELVWFQLGLERYLTGLVTGSSAVKNVLERSVGIQKRYIVNILDLVGDYVDIVAMNGDLGGQDHPLISPSTYKDALKPYEKEFIDTIKGKTDAALIRHTCGNVFDLIPQFIELGLDGLNPVQVSAGDMDPARLKDRYGEKIVFWGGIDTQTVLPNGTPGEVRQEVRNTIEALAPGGGYILGAVHNIQRDVPPENICAMFDAAREFGGYPIR